jgi:3-methyladenine DNA glycosylase AlkD
MANDKKTSAIPSRLGAGMTARNDNGNTGDVSSVLDWLKKNGSAKVRDTIGPRFGIVVKNAFGVTMTQLKQLAKITGRDHDLAVDLWKSGYYDARMLACLIDEPAKVTSSQMDAWCADFDNWATCDTACFALFDKTPYALAKVKLWAKRKPEFEKRAAFALLASVALHDKKAPDAPIIALIPVCEKAANDERNFVKKGVSWALRTIGTRSAACHAAALEMAERLAASTDKTERWVGKDVLRDITRPLVAARLIRIEAKKGSNTKNKQDLFPTK